MIDSYVYKKTEVSWDREIELTRQAIQAVNSMQPKPRFFVVCGDLVDAMPGDKNKEAQEKDFKSVISQLDPNIPAICVCGNHDIGNVPTIESVQNYTKNFGDDYFSFWVAGVKFIVINSQFYEDASQVPSLKVAHDEWLEEELSSMSTMGSQHIVVFQHIPWFLHSPDEDKEYFNIDLPTRKVMINKFRNAGVQKIFCGHYHRNAGGFDGNVEVIVTSAIGCQIGSDPHGCRVVKIMQDCITHKYYGLNDLPQQVDLSRPSFTETKLHPML